MELQYDRNLGRELALLNHEGRRFRIPRRLNQDRYEVFELLAVGGMGAIFIARDHHLDGKKVLIKRCLYPPSLFEHENDRSRAPAIENLRRAINTEHAAMLHGWARRIPSIPIPLDFFQDVNPDIFGPHTAVSGRSFSVEPELHATEPYLVINYFTGYPIKSDHPEVHRNVVGFTRFFINNVGNILKRFHRPHIGGGKSFDFHYCDLKPDNVLQTEDKQVVLIDMGSFAIRLDGDLVNDITTTPGYCAPELRSQQARCLSPAVDVYTLALCAFELITGKRPELHPDHAPKLDWTAFDRIVEQAGATGFKQVFRKALESDPRQRFETMQGFIDALTGKKDAARPLSPASYTRINQPPSVVVAGDWGSDINLIRHTEAQGAPVISYDVWHPKTYFDLQARAVRVNSQAGPDPLREGLIRDLFEQSKTNLIQNITFFPELLATGPENTFIVHFPLFWKGKMVKHQVRKRLQSILYLFMKLCQMAYRLLGISPGSIVFDHLGNPCIAEFWLALPSASAHFLENPLVHDILGRHILMPPEVKTDRKWAGDASFSYLAGLAALLMLDANGLFAHNRNGRLYEKQHYERLVKKQALDDPLTEVILNLLSPVPGMRPALYESISKLKQRQYDVVERAASNRGIRGIQLQYTQKLKQYRFEFREIQKVTDRFLSWQQLEKRIVLHHEPAGTFLEGLNRSRTRAEVVTPADARARIIALLNETVAQGQTELVVLIMDDTVRNMAGELAPVLEKFRKVILFSEQNPFALENLTHHSIKNYMIKKW